MALAPGTRLGPYEIVTLLGAGGMGEVYKAHHTRLGRDVEIKVLLAHLRATSEVRARFEREARAISQLNHPHICSLHDIGRQDDIDYLVMEYLEGETLAARLTKGPLPFGEVLRQWIKIAGAVDCAHRAGIVHRDLKPGNIMLTKRGAKLTDFGLARPARLSSVIGAGSESPTGPRPITAEGTFVGTFQYMAPGQLEGKEADTRADVWALSPDSRWALAIDYGPPHRLNLIPTGSGETLSLLPGPVETYQTADFLPDGRRIVFVGAEPGHPQRTWIQELPAGLPRAVTPEGTVGVRTSPDGQWIAAVTQDYTLALFPLQGGAPRLLAKLEPRARLSVSQWSADGRTLYVSEGRIRLNVFGIDVQSGKRQLWKTFELSDPAGAHLQGFVMNRDARS